MSILPFAKGATLLIAVATASTASAEVTYSTSNNPGFMLEEDAIIGDGSTVSPEYSHVYDMMDEQLGYAFPDVALDLADIMTPEYLRDMPKAAGGDEWECLTEALYFEARGEKLTGIFAVADVILNRVEDARFPDSVCGVVRQGTGEKWMCQFSYYCDGEPEVVEEPRAWSKVAKVARIMLDQDNRDLTEGATHYHTKAVKPYWAKVFPRVATIGYHYFYREPSKRG